MATVTVWRFDDTDGAERAAKILGQQRGHAYDAATVTWETGAGRPATHQVTTGAGSLGNGFWGLLFGLVFFVPLLGAALGTAPGAEAGSLAEAGIDDTFVNRIRDQLTPGTSALFVVTSEPPPDALHDALTGGGRAEVVSTDLSAEQAAALREVFAD